MQGLVSDEKLRWQKECVSSLAIFASQLLTILENVMIFWVKDEHLITSLISINFLIFYQCRLCFFDTIL